MSEIWRSAEGKEGSRGKDCASEDQELGVCDMLSPIQEPKWKILDYPRYPRPEEVKLFVTSPLTDAG